MLNNSLLRCVRIAKCHVVCAFAVQRLQAPQSERSRREHDERQQTVGSLRQLRQTAAWRNTQRVKETGLTNNFDPEQVGKFDFARSFLLIVGGIL